MNERTMEIQTWPIIEGPGGAPFFRAPAGVPWCAENVLIGKDVTIEDEVIIRPGCVIWHHVKIWGRSVICDFASIKPFASIGERALIGESAMIGHGVHVADMCIIGARTGLEHGSRIHRGTELGRGAVVGPGGVDPVDLGWADGYRKVAAGTDRLEMRITAGCRNFSWHWTAYGPSRGLTLALVQRAADIAKIKGWDIN